MPSQSVCIGPEPTRPRSRSMTVRRNTALFERHWTWVCAPPRGADATLRLLVEEASRDRQGKYRAQRLKEDCYYLMRDLAGDRPGFEEATRALFAEDLERLSTLAAAWPANVADPIIVKATLACAGHPPTSPEGAR